MKARLLEPVRRLLADVAADLLERGGEPAPPRRPSSIAEAQAAVRDQLGLLYVERRRIERDAASAAADLDQLLARAEFAVRHDREDLARAALTHRDDLEQRRASLATQGSAIALGIDLLERAAATLADADGPEARDAARLAAQLAELDRLLQDKPGNAST